MAETLVNNSKPQDNEDNGQELQRFNWGNDSEPTATDDSDVNRGGWSVEDMFRKNQSLGVKSTFKDDLTQYTTVRPEGDYKDRARAAKIAREIEQNKNSKRMAYLENDDEERDLDKETFIPGEALEQPPQLSSQQQGSKPSPVTQKFNRQKESLKSWQGNFNAAFQNSQSTPEQSPTPLQSSQSPSLQQQQQSQIPPPAAATSPVVTPRTTPAPSESETSAPTTGKKFEFNPDAPAFVPRMRPTSTPVTFIPMQRPPSTPISYIPMQQTSTPISFIPMQATNTFIPAGYVHAQPQTFVVRSNYDYSTYVQQQVVQPQQPPQPRAVQYYMPMQYQGPPLAQQGAPQQVSIQYQPHPHQLHQQQQPQAVSIQYQPQQPPPQQQPQQVPIQFQQQALPHQQQPPQQQPQQQQQLPYSSYPYSGGLGG